MLGLEGRSGLTLQAPGGARQRCAIAMPAGLPAADRPTAVAGAQAADLAHQVFGFFDGSEQFLHPMSAHLSRRRRTPTVATGRRPWCRTCC